MRCFRCIISQWAAVALAMEAVALAGPPAYGVSMTPAEAELFASPVCRRCLWPSLRYQHILLLAILLGQGKATQRRMEN